MGMDRIGVHSKDLQARSEYVKKLFCQEDQALLAAKKQAKNIHPEIMISSQEGKMLQCFIKSIQAKKVVEIGAFTGYSALWIVKALPSDGFFWTLELQKEHAELSRLSLLEEKPACGYEVLLGPADFSLKRIEGHGPFDVVFIDADKAGYVKYLDWVERHLRKGGLVIGDNAFLFGHVYKEAKPDGISLEAWESMRQFNQRLSDVNKYTSIILPTEEGMAVAVKEF